MRPGHGPLLPTIRGRPAAFRRAQQPRGRSSRPRAARRRPRSALPRSHDGRARGSRRRCSPIPRPSATASSTPSAAGCRRPRTSDRCSSSSTTCTQRPSRRCSPAPRPSGPRGLPALPRSHLRHRARSHRPARRHPRRPAQRPWRRAVRSPGSTLMSGDFILFPGLVLEIDLAAFYSACNLDGLALFAAHAGQCRALLRECAVEASWVTAEVIHGERPGTRQIGCYDAQEHHHGPQRSRHLSHPPVLHYETLYGAFGRKRSPFLGKMASWHAAIANDERERTNEPEPRTKNQEPRTDPNTEMGFFDKIKQSLTRTKEQFVGRFDEVVKRADEPARREPADRRGNDRGARRGAHLRGRGRRRDRPDRAGRPRAPRPRGVAARASSRKRSGGSSAAPRRRSATVIARTSS